MPKLTLFATMPHDLGHNLWTTSGGAQQNRGVAFCSAPSLCIGIDNSISGFEEGFDATHHDLDTFVGDAFRGIVGLCTGRWFVN